VADPDHTAHMVYFDYSKLTRWQKMKRWIMKRVITLRIICASPFMLAGGILIMLGMIIDGQCGWPWPKEIEEEEI